MKVTGFVLSTCLTLLWGKERFLSGWKWNQIISVTLFLVGEQEALGLRPEQVAFCFVSFFDFFRLFDFRVGSLYVALDDSLCSPGWA